MSKVLLAWLWGLIVVYVVALALLTTSTDAPGVYYLLGLVGGVLMCVCTVAIRASYGF